MENQTFDYSTEDAEQLTIINSMLLELLYARFISKSENADEEIKFLKTNLGAVTRTIASDSNNIGRLATATVKHIEQIVGRKGNQFVNVKFVENFPPPQV